MKWLKKVNDPKDLKKLDLKELESYSQELREYLIETMSKVGGHVAANLGVVELTTALHYVFNTPHDRIVWDVGHQCYAHKVITGRRDRFPTIRQDGGISGFTKITESPYDAFGAGHSSTAISAGVGFAEGEWQAGSQNIVVSVVGDGALTAGMAYEGLNHAGHMRRPNFIVVFNDNEMSISENVGALAQFFGKRVNSAIYNTVRDEVKVALKALSSKEIDIYEKVRTLSHVVKDFFTASSFFEALGFRYIGPIDGHDLPELVSTLNSVKDLSLNAISKARANARTEGFEVDPPILVHVKTKKGCGLKAAEDHPGDFHGVAGFDKKTGEPIKKPASAPSYTSVFAKTLCKIAEKDKKIMAVTAAMPEGTGLSLFQKKFPERFYDVGIAEQHAVTFASAMRLTGSIPAVAIYSTFLQRAYDQVIHDAAIQKIPLALFLDRAGLVGADGPTHHGAFDLSFLRCVPGMNIMAPKDENELQHMVYTALYCGELASVRFPRGEGCGVHIDENFKMLALGKSEKVLPLPIGKAVTPVVSIWAVGSCVYPAIEAGKELNEIGIACEVVNARFVKPLDKEALLEDVRQSRLLVTVEENALAGGFGSAVLECLSQEGIQVPVLNLGIPDEFIEHGSPARLKNYVKIDQKSIVAQTLKRLESIKSITVKPQRESVLTPEPQRKPGNPQMTH